MLLREENGKESKDRRNEPKRRAEKSMERSQWKFSKVGEPTEHFKNGDAYPQFEATFLCCSTVFPLNLQ